VNAAARWKQRFSINLYQMSCLRINRIHRSSRWLGLSPIFELNLKLLLIKHLSYQLLENLKFQEIGYFSEKKERTEKEEAVFQNPLTDL
jgi:hypothetical protein